MDEHGADADEEQQSDLPAAQLLSSAFCVAWPFIPKFASLTRIAKFFPLAGRRLEGLHYHYSWRRHSTGSRRAALLAGVMPKVIPTAQETTSATMADVTDTGT